MGFRDYLQKLEKSHKLQKISASVSKHLEASGILKAIEPKAVLFEKIKESNFKVAGNVFPTKDSIADYVGCETSELISTINKAISNMKAPEETKNAKCQEVVEEIVDLDKLPILFHCAHDGGNYISSGIVVSKDKEFGQNLDFHRMMQIGKNKFSVRIVKERNFDTFLKKNGEMDIAVCIGNGANVLVAAATSIEIGKNELGIANALEPLTVTRAKTSDLLIPSDCEFVIEGRIVLEEKANEGPFVDLTETLDVVRQEPVLTVKKITHRKDAIWQALLPGALEHKVLMGMPREPTIFKKVNEAGVKCIDVNVNPGGCSWLHAIVKIDKQNEDDGKKAIDAAFEGHKSCKHIFIVDKDIDIYNPLDVEWAMATRFQADVDFKMKAREKGSSLDPSADPETHFTTKCGLDCTASLQVKGKNFSKEPFPQVDLKKYLK
ncbi:MAG: UbiD family decarboxylase [Candidatus Diapherotrites archaeon]|nr:UbiD family decarboxylase [Candidatus Diapherotrites archaeon]